MRKIRVAHISDLHCNTNKNWWGSYFKPILECLEKEAPQVVIITGDCVDHPEQKNFDVFKKAVNEMKVAVENGLRTRPDDPQELFIITIPGNHDVHDAYGLNFKNIFRLNWWGSVLVKIVSIIPYVKMMVRHPAETSEEEWQAREALFRANWPYFLEPQISIDHDQNNSETAIQSVVKKLFLIYQIAIYPLNSNRAEGSLPIARGALKNVAETINQYDSIFSNLSTEHNLSQGDALRIAILHHHPFPVFNQKGQRQNDGDNLLNLNNPHDLLTACSDSGVHMILHGHKHRSGEHIIEYRNSNDAWLPIVISAVGSASNDKLKEKGPWEIKVLESNKSGDLFLKRFRRMYEPNKVSRFNQDFNKLILTYGRRRRMRWERTIPEGDPVKVAVLKSKSVAIDQEGGGWVRIAIEGIEWTEQALETNNYYLSQRFRGDTGRIQGVWTGFFDTPHPPPSELEFFEKCDTQDDKGNYLFQGAEGAAPNKPEGLKRVFHREETVDSIPRACRHAYFLYNGFATSVIEHEECYPEWKKRSKEKDLQEAVTVSADHRTRVLDLTVRFPLDRMPNNFLLEAFQRTQKDNGVPRGMQDIYRDYPIHER
ncbi:MAG: metallophosphoesterase, partial [Magnetococcales bacterium]|nr:metallophosphoesterase [Magnetococcales bacterium]